MPDSRLDQERVDCFASDLKMPKQHAQCERGHRETVGSFKHDRCQDVRRNASADVLLGYEFECLQRAHAGIRADTGPAVPVPDVSVAEVLTTLSRYGEGVLSGGLVFTLPGPIAQAPKDADAVSGCVVKHPVQECHASAIVRSEHREEWPVREGRQW